MPPSDRPADRPAAARRYSDQEVSLILRRAAELQADQPGAAGGTSLAELEDVAREAGLDPALVRRAAADLAVAAPARAPSRFLGAATKLHAERVVDGELSMDDVEVLVEEVRRTFGDPGLVSTLGRTVTWNPTPSVRAGVNTAANGRRLYVTISTRGGQTTLRAEEDLGPLAGGLFGGLMGGIGGGLTAPAVAIGAGAFHAALPVVGLVAAVVGGSYTLARTIYVGMARRREKELRQLVERLGAYAERAVTP